RRADVPRRARAGRELRRPLPRGVPDARRRGPARRRALPARRGLGVQGRRPRAGPPHRIARIPVRAPDPEELQVRINLRVWRQDGPDAPGAFQDFPDLEALPEMSFLELLDVVNRRLE